MNPDCIFCKFITKEIPTSGVYEDDSVYAFLDREPLNIGHVLIIPKVHYRNIYDIDETTLAHMSMIAKKIAVAEKELLHTDGVNIHMNNEKPAGQSVFHAHLHVMPRYENDGFPDWTRPHYEEEKVFAIADALKNSLM